MRSSGYIISFFEEFIMKDLSKFSLIDETYGKAGDNKELYMINTVIKFR